MGGGKGGGGASKQYNRFGTIAMAHCCGPVDELVAYILNGKKAWPIADEWVVGTAYVTSPSPSMVSRGERVWTCILAHTATEDNAPASATDSSLSAPPDSDTHWTEYSVRRSDHPTHFDFTTEKNGPVRFYWGTETQTACAYLDDNEFGEEHPAYLGVCYSVLGQGTKTASLSGFLYGREQENTPTVSALVRKKPQTTLVTGVTELEDGSVNPAAFIEERLTDPLSGMAVPVAELDAASFQRLADVADRDRERYYISTVFTAAASFRSFIDDIGLTLDWFLRFKHGDGTFELGAWPRNTGQPFDIPLVVSAGDVVLLTGDFSWLAYDTFDSTTLGISEESLSASLLPAGGYGWDGPWLVPPGGGVTIAHDDFETDDLTGGTGWTGDWIMTG